MKPVDKNAKKMMDGFANAHLEPNQLQRDVRKARKEWKKLHSKHVRRKAKQELKDSTE